MAQGFRELTRTAHGRLALIAAMLSGVALVGWLSGAQILTTVLPGRPHMVPSTALGLLIAARALAVIGVGEQARKLAVLQMLLGLATMGAHMTGIAETSAASPWSWSSRWTGLAFAISGLSTWLLASGKLWEGQCVAFITLLLLTLIGFGHLVPKADLYEYLPGSGVSILTILAFMCVSAGQLLSFAQPESRRPLRAEVLRALRACA